MKVSLPLPNPIRSALFASALATTFAACPAQATILDFTVDWTGGTVETFAIDTTTGHNDAAGTPPYVYFDTINDSLGRDAIFFGDSSTGGWTGTGTVINNLVNQVNSDYFSPAFYADNGVNVDIAPGRYVGRDGSTLTVSAVPEPSTWAMMILGFLGVGFMAYRKTTTVRFA
jgi:PEP-CTERM motif